MADLGEVFTVIRNRQVSHEVDAVAENSRVLKLYLDTDVKLGDVLKGKLSNKEFTVINIEYEVWERERTVMIARCK